MCPTKGKWLQVTRHIPPCPGPEENPGQESWGQGKGLRKPRTDLHRLRTFPSSLLGIQRRLNVLVPLPQGFPPIREFSEAPCGLDSSVACQKLCFRVHLTLNLVHWPGVWPIPPIVGCPFQLTSPTLSLRCILQGLGLTWTLIPVPHPHPFAFNSVLSTLPAS